MRTHVLVAALLAAVAQPAAGQIAAGGRLMTMPIDALAGTVQGSVVAQCGARGTTLQFSLSGLVPHGSYSLWMFVFGTSGDAPTPADAVAAGALGGGDGRSHEFRADAAGRAELALVQPAGPLSAFGAVRGCLLDAPHWRVVGGYHPARASAGVLMPAAGEIVQHFGVRSTTASVWSTH
jgi:hypothetical protein